MKKLLSLFAVAVLASLSACSSAPKATSSGVLARTAVADTRGKIATVKASTALTRTRTAAIGASVGKAQDQAAKVAQSFTELRSALDAAEQAAPKGSMQIARAKLAERQAAAEAAALQAQLAEVRRNVDLANEQAQIADARAAEAEASAAQSETRVEQLVQDEARKTVALEKSEAQRKEENRLKWKWRFIAFGTWTLIAGYFVARHYFPFLKLIL
jgi:chromosome segregation ATPase